jgi:hypothetical protein
MASARWYISHEILEIAEKPSELSHKAADLQRIYERQMLELKTLIQRLP